MLPVILHSHVQQSSFRAAPDGVELTLNNESGPFPDDPAVNNRPAEVVNLPLDIHEAIDPALNQSGASRL